MAAKNSIILVGNEKGGVGKTTLAFNLAVMRVKAGSNVILVDTDKQGSSAMWASLRAEEEGNQPPLLCVQKSGKVGADLLALQKVYEVIVDAGGQDSVELRQAIAVADQWVIPVRPGQLDLVAMTKMRQLRRDVFNRVGQAPDTSVLLNAVSASTKEGDEARALLNEENDELGEEEGGRIKVMSSMMVDRVSVRRAMRFGCAVVELPGKESSGPALTEISAVYKEIFGVAYEPQA